MSKPIRPHAHTQDTQHGMERIARMPTECTSYSEKRHVSEPASLRKKCIQHLDNEQNIIRSMFIAWLDVLWCSLQMVRCCYTYSFRKEVQCEYVILFFLHIHVRVHEMKKSKSEKYLTTHQVRELAEGAWWYPLLLATFECFPEDKPSHFASPASPSCTPPLWSKL